MLSETKCNEFFSKSPEKPVQNPFHSEPRLTPIFLAEKHFKNSKAGLSALNTSGSLVIGSVHWLVGEWWVLFRAGGFFSALGLGVFPGFFGTPLGKGL